MVRTQLQLRLVAILARWVIRALGRAARVEVFGREHIDGLERAGARYLFVLWHGRMLLPIYFHRNLGIAAIVSRHKDGELIARTIKGLGYLPIRGSSTRGGKEAYYEMIRFLQGPGPPGAIMPDGPRGPAREFKPGAVYIARQSGACLVPLSFAAQRSWTLPSWDSFSIQAPLSRCAIIYGKPIPVPADAQETELERLRKDCEKSLNEIEQRAASLINKEGG